MTPQKVSAFQLEGVELAKLGCARLIHMEKQHHEDLNTPINLDGRMYAKVFDKVNKMLWKYLLKCFRSAIW